MAGRVPPVESSAASTTGQRLEKKLTLFDDYVIGLEPMLSSGFFLPDGSLIALVHRDLTILVPRGDTILREGDRLSFVGDPEAIRAIGAPYGSIRESQ